MTISQAHTQALVGALAAASQAITLHQGQKHERAMSALRSGVLTEIVDAMVNRRVEAVKDGFHQILSQYAEQARHYMAQQAKYGEAELEASDPLRRVELNKRIRDIDIELASLRADAMLLYGRMTEVVSALGGSLAGFGPDLAQPLLLSAPRMAVLS